MTQLARERADARIDAALGALRQAAKEIGKEHGIPDGIAGHSVDELLGRMGYVPSMARDLRRATAQELAKQELSRAFDREPLPAKPRGRPVPSHASGGSTAPQDPPPRPLIDVSKRPATAPVGLDVSELSGITVQTARALKAAGLDNVGQVMAVPDEHLLKISGLAEKSVAQLRHAIANASAPPQGPVS